MSRSDSLINEEVLCALNDQISLELKASHFYLAMHAYFAHDINYLPGLSKFFKVSSDEERDHAEKLIKYMIERGGKVIMSQIPSPQSDFGTSLNAIDIAIALENQVTKSLENLVLKADSSNDSDFSDFITSVFIREQHEALKKLSDMFYQLKRVMDGSKGQGEYIWDQNLLKSL